MSNRVFSEKVKHYINSEIGLTKELANRKSWEFNDVVNRTKDLADKAVQIWKFSKPIPEINSPIESTRILRGQYGIASDTDLFCKGLAADAIANIVDNNIVRVQKGSKARLEAAPSFKEHNYKKLRDQLENDGILKEEGESLVFTADYDFSSASAAAAVILGNAVDGPSAWKDKDGRSIYKMSDISKDTPDDAIDEKESLRKEFWVELLKKSNEKFSLFSSATPSDRSAIGVSSKNSQFSYFYYVVNSYGGCGLYLRASKELNKKRFDILFSHKKEIEREFGEELSWLRKDDKKGSEIDIFYDESGLANKGKWNELQDKMIDSMVKFEKIFSRYIEELD